MDAIITKIFEIEYRSRDIMREAEEKRDGLDEMIVKSKEQLRQTIETREQKHLESERNQVLNKADADAKAHLQHAQSKIEAMERFEKTKRAEWIEALYQRIISAE